MSQNQEQPAGLPRQKRQFCTFYIGDDLYGIDILDVKEIIDEVKLTQIHHAANEILGLMNIRGQVYLVLDLRLLLNFQKKDIDEMSRVLLFHSKVGESFGVMVDQIGHMVEVHENLIEYRVPDDKSLPGSEKNKSDLEVGACKLKNQLLIILDASKFLNAVSIDTR